MAYVWRGTAPQGQLKGITTMSIASEFKEFAMRGNVIDLAVVSDVEQALGDAKALGAVAQQIELRI